MEKMRNKWQLGLLMGVLCVLLLTGCGSKEETVATLDKEEITLSEAVFYTRLNQQQWEQAYVETFGEDFWSQSLGEELGTFADELKQQVMDTICQIHLMNAHAKEYDVKLTKEEEADIEERVASFMDSHSQDVKEAAGADEKLVKELLTARVLADKVAEAMVADYEPEVTQEEAALKKMTYCLFATTGTYDSEGNYRAVTAAEAEAIAAEAELFAQTATELGDIAAAGAVVNHTCIDVYFSDTANGGAHEKVAETVRTLELGQIAGPIKTEEGYYVIQYVSDFDEEATAENRENLIQAKKEAKCQEIYQQWLSEAEFTINQEVWDTVKVDKVLFVP